jgi:hypothetical protein
MQPHADTTQPPDDHTRDATERFTVSEAAEILGITAEAVRQRIRRGTLPSERDEVGSVFVFLKPHKHRANRQPYADPTQPHADPTTDNTVLYERMSSEIDHLRAQLDKERDSSAELRRIIAALTQRIPELEPAREASPEPRGSSTPPSEEEADTPPSPKGLDQEKRSWWRRFFGVE